MENTETRRVNNKNKGKFTYPLCNNERNDYFGINKTILRFILRTEEGELI